MALIFSTPLAVLVSVFFSDDTFYYLKTALNFSKSSLSTFDGEKGCQMAIRRYSF